ncbi:MAG: endo-1,4-beta-xylanase, partial [Porcipelethomonas sp.]
MALSIQYDDSTGTTKYANIQKVTSQGEWVSIADAKFSFPSGSTNMSIYFECSSEATADIMLDDFELSTAPVYEIQQDIPSLKDVYADYFKFGGAVTDSELSSESAQALIKKHYNSITPGNELKPESLLDQKACQEQGNNVNPIINIAPARNILDFCRDNDISVRGHVLVWHSQTPGWFFKENFDSNGDFVSKDIMLQRMENYIKNVMTALAEEYPTVDFYAWDVVNEAWLDDGSCRTPGTYDENSNYSGWVQVFGDNSFIPYAFEYARKYAPEGCKLYYNDFNEYMPAKTTAIVNMANELKEKGLIDGIGMQSHLDVRSGSDAFPSVSVYEKAMKAFVDTGLDVQVTELDATVNEPTEACFEAQAQYYSDILDACVKYSDSISAVVLWGTTDDKSWRASKYPLVFNEDFTAKSAYYAIVDGLEVPETTEPVTTEPTEPTTEAVTTTAATDPVETTETQLTTVTQTTTIVGDDSVGILSIGSLPEKLEYRANTDEALSLFGLTVSLSVKLENMTEVIYDNVYPSDYTDVFIIDDSEFDITTPGIYTITVKCTDETAAYYHVADNKVTFEVTVAEDTGTSIEFGTPTLIGDADLNGTIGVSDVVKTAKFISSNTLYPLRDSVAAANADVNYDKQINSLDVSKMIEYVLRCITEF